MDGSGGEDPGLAAGVELIVFSRDVALMPQAGAPADIIRLHNVTVQFWAGRTQLMGQLALHRPFSYQLFSGAAYGPELPYRLGGGRDAACQLGLDDLARLAELRALAAAQALTGNDGEAFCKAGGLRARLQASLANPELLTCPLPLADLHRPHCQLPAQGDGPEPATS